MVVVVAVEFFIRLAYQWSWSSSSHITIISITLTVTHTRRWCRPADCSGTVSPPLEWFLINKAKPSPVSLGSAFSSFSQSSRGWKAIYCCMCISWGEKKITFPLYDYYMEWKHHHHHLHEGNHSIYFLHIYRLLDDFMLFSCSPFGIHLVEKVFSLSS